MASPTTLRLLLEGTSLPAEVLDELLSAATALWLVGVPDEVVAGEAVLCHPALAAGEVRAAVKPTDDPARFRMTVVTGDHSGLLAATAGVLAEAGLTIVDAAAAVLPESRLALQRLTVTSTGTITSRESGPIDDDGWDALGQRLRDVHGSHLPVPRAPWAPAAPVAVETQPQEMGRVVVTVHAPDRAGLLAAIGGWFEDHGANVEMCQATGEDGMAHDVFVVAGAVDADELATALGGHPVTSTGAGVWALTFGLRATRAGLVWPWKAAATITQGVIGAVVATRRPRHPDSP
ncbi:MAG: ACT domain-containing protein [Acidimicrobiales bacterium]